jgi:hypothetical protein
MGMRDRNIFIEYILNHPGVKNLPQEKKRERLDKMLLDLDKDGIFDPIVANEYDEADILEEMELKGVSPEEAFMEILRQQQSVINPEIEEHSNQRIRQKRMELAKDPKYGIVLDENDFLPTGMIKNKGKKMVCPYGRTPLHQAIALRDIDLIKKYAKNKRYINAKDNNGNTPYEMAFQQNYKEAMKILKKYMKEKCNK